jgi:beta-N-acetylhexosaminidase
MRSRISWLVACVLFVSAPAGAGVTLREKLGQMVMITVTGDSLEETGPSMETLKSDLANRLVGGVVMFVWSDNLVNQAHIARFTGQLQALAHVPLLLAIDQEGGRVARLSASNGFAATSTAYDLGTVLNQESSTRSMASMMAGWFVETGLTMNLAPVVDVNVNPASPAIGALKRSFSADAATVARHASWFIDEFHAKHVLTALKHFPGHGSAKADSHLGFTDITTTWSNVELDPYRTLLAEGKPDAIMTGHLFNGTIDSVYPATLSYATITGILRDQLGFGGVVMSDAMGMAAITSHYGLDEAMVLAVNAGVDILLYTTNLDSAGHSLAGRIVDVLERHVQEGTIPVARIDASYARIMALKGTYVTSVDIVGSPDLPSEMHLASFPNPFNPVTTLQYTLGSDGPAKLQVFDLLGRLVATLVDGYHRAGVHSVRFDGTGLGSGMYICRLESAGAVATHRLALLK